MSLTSRRNKLEHLYLELTFQTSLIFDGNSRSLPRRKHLKGAPIGLALALPSNSKTWLERVSKDKCTSLLGLVISDEGKEFYNIKTRSKIFRWSSDAFLERGRLLQSRSPFFSKFQQLVVFRIILLVSASFGQKSFGRQTFCTAVIHLLSRYRSWMVKIDFFSICHFVFCFNFS